MRNKGKYSPSWLVGLVAALAGCGQDAPSHELRLRGEDSLAQGLTLNSQQLTWKSHTGYCLGVTHNSSKNGTSVHLQKCSQGAGQKWTYANGQLKTLGNKCLDVTGGTVRNGTRLQIWDCTDGDTNQLWTSSGGQLTWKGHTLCLDVVDGQASQGQPIQVWACDTANTNQQWAAASSGSGSSSSSSGSTSSSGSSSSTSAASGTTVNGMLQGGSGWPGDINVAATSAQYYGLTLDQLKSRKCELARELAQFPAVEAAIRKVSKETGVPDGLLAGVAYQESSFIVTSTSGNPNPTSSDTEDVGVMQCPVEDFSGSSWQDPYTNIHLFVTKYFLPAYKQHKSWGVALRLWNSGEYRASDLSWQDNQTDGNYINEILGKHCLGLD